MICFDWHLFNDSWSLAFFSCQLIKFPFYELPIETLCSFFVEPWILSICCILLIMNTTPLVICISRLHLNFTLIHEIFCKYRRIILNNQIRWSSHCDFRLLILIKTILLYMFSKDTEFCFSHFNLYFTIFWMAWHGNVFVQGSWIECLLPDPSICSCPQLHTRLLSTHTRFLPLSYVRGFSPRTRASCLSCFNHCKFMCPPSNSSELSDLFSILCCWESAFRDLWKTLLG